jgi:hypothetical protein
MSDLLSNYAKGFLLSKKGDCFKKIILLFNHILPHLIYEKFSVKTTDLGTSFF